MCILFLVLQNLLDFFLQNLLDFSFSSSDYFYCFFTDSDLHLIINEGFPITE